MIIKSILYRKLNHVIFTRKSRTVEDVSAKHFKSIISNGHWVYCAYILLNSSPPGFPAGMKSMAEKQLMVSKIIENKGLSTVNQLLTQVKGSQRLKSIIQKALNDGSIVGSPALCGFAGI